MIAGVIGHDLRVMLCLASQPHYEQARAPNKMVMNTIFFVIVSECRLYMNVTSVDKNSHIVTENQQSHCYIIQLLILSDHSKGLPSCGPTHILLVAIYQSRKVLDTLTGELHFHISTFSPFLVSL